MNKYPTVSCRLGGERERERERAETERNNTDRDRADVLATIYSTGSLFSSLPIMASASIYIDAPCFQKPSLQIVAPLLDIALSKWPIPYRLLVGMFSPFL